MKNLSYCVAGIDVSKQALDACVLTDGNSWSRATGDAMRLCRSLKRRGVELAVVEPTGGYEYDVVAALEQVGIPVAVVNARLIRNFARASGILAKTDKIDARVLAEYAVRMTPTPRPRKSAACGRLSILVRRRRQLVAMRKTELTRRPQTRDADILQDIQRTIDFIASEIRVIETRIERHIADHFEETAALLRSMPGIGPVAAASLIAELPELGTLSRRKIAALVGLAPFNRDSGAYQGKRIIWGGRAQLRSVLHRGVISAIRRENQFKFVYDRLRERGKPHKVATVAVLRKMIVQLNAIIRDQIPYKYDPA